MSKNKNTLGSRSVGTRKYRPVYWVSAEGKTENDYFNMDLFRNLDFKIKFPPDINPYHREPRAVLDRFKNGFKKSGFHANDEAWLVVDVDEWPEKEFDELFKWEQEDPRHHLAISNPKFELFLLMHRDTGKGCTTSSQVDRRLSHVMPDYSKRLNPGAFKMNEVTTALSNAKRKRAACEEKFPEPGMTDVYKLVESLLGRTLQ